MTRKILATIALVAGMAACGNYVSYTGTAHIDGNDLFYAVEGKGKPVILIHGNGGSHTDLETTQRQLAQAGYTVYAMDSRGQGANKPLEEYHYKDMARDVATFIKDNKISHPAVFGWSDGGIIALELESMYPGTCSLIATSGANITATNAIDPDTYRSIFGTRENVDSMPPLVRMMYLEPNMTSADMARIKVPVLVCAGENDLITREHTTLIANSLPEGELKIIPGHDHGSHIWHNTLMGDILLDFFKAHNY